jgi:hypothetical protein
MVGKNKSSLLPESKIEAEKLWDELSHDANILADRSEVHYYKKRLKEILTE